MPQWADRTGWGDQAEGDSIILPYHEPIESHRSLKFITTDLRRFLSKSDELQGRSGIKSCSHQRFYVDGQAVYALYTDSPSGVPNEWAGSDTEVTKYISSVFDEQEIPLLVLIFTVFESVTEGVPDDSMRMYKTFDLEAFAEVFRNLQWRQSVPDVGTELLSRFICRHPLPNTNHRSGIGVLGSYFQAFDENVELPSTGVDDEWHEWAEDYVLSSKRILTLRRKAGLLEHARSLGVDMVQRKDGILIDLVSEHENMQRPDAFQHYTQEHRERTQPFVHRLLERSDATHLQDVTDDGKRAFLNRIESSHSTGQIEELSASGD